MTKATKETNVRIFNTPTEVINSGFSGTELVLGKQIIVATDVAIAEATRRVEEMKQLHPKTMKREIKDLIPDVLFTLFAEDWQSEHNPE